MAEYTLKVQIDPSQLRSQLQAALGKVNMGKMFAGGGGGSSGGFGGAGFTPGQNQKMFEKMQKLLQLQVNAAEKRGAIAKKGWMGKFGPSVMKLAGITMGLAALRQVGSALIDASPLLQAMAKIGNTAFTLFLRPFGDFIGFLLRPFLILMLKHAIKFYKLFGGAQAKEAVDRFTERATGQTECGEFCLNQLITTALVGGGNPVIGALKQGFLDMFSKWMDAIFNIDIPTFGFLGYRRIPKDELTPEQEEQIKQSQEEERKKAEESCIYPWIEKFNTDFVAPPTEEEKSRDFEGLQKMLSGGATLKDIFNAIMKSEKLQESFFATKTGDTLNEQLKNFLGITKEELDGATISMIDTSAQFGNIAQLSVQATENIDKAKDESVKIAKLYVTARRAGLSAKDSMILIADTMKIAQDRVLAILSKLATTTVPTHKGDGTKPEECAPQAGEIVSESECNILVDPTPPPPPRVTQEELDKQAIDSIISYNKAFGWAPPMSPPSPYGKIYPCVVSDYKSKYPDYRTSEYATGGIISEPVIGVGMSGRKYSFGERGAEKVTPISGSEGSNGDNYYATFYVTGVDIDQFETKVKPMVFRWLNELKSNAGIL